MMNTDRTKTGTRSRYDLQLDNLKRELASLASLCCGMLSEIERNCRIGRKSDIKYFEKSEKEAAAIEKKIDRLCMLLILRQQPVASDLILIAKAERVSTDLGRIAHLCNDLSGVLCNISGITSLEMLYRMAVISLDQLTLAINEVLDLSEKAEEEIELLDDHIDQLYENLRLRLIEENRDTQQSADVLVAAKYFERIGDHCVLIARTISEIRTMIHSE